MSVCATRLSCKLKFFFRRVVSKTFAFSCCSNESCTRDRVEFLGHVRWAQDRREVYTQLRRTGSSFVSALIPQLHAMTWYKYVQKYSKDKQQFESFHPLRVAGLAYEKGWKFVHKRGLKALRCKHVESVTVSGGVRVQSGQRWRKVQSYSFKGGF